ncbi:hypothetical protein [Asaia krungthepensis]|uniref:Uncharacterized protein n=1 Tax=Asaia krungthepensis NRIC 0535 TaxID=1307925 RepID=A0ABQ0Q368_9PROT|nr:hypothetical protein [Asaia krungthepensis]GBQ89107.1 hypothetical protein AA0535_1713 [Asaia krungthepensis NRIC 0535]
MAGHFIESDLLDNLGGELVAISDTLLSYEIRLRGEGKSEQADRISWRRRSLAEYREALREAPVMEVAQ